MNTKIISVTYDTTTTFQIRIVQKKNQQSLLTHHQGNVIIRIIPIGKL